MNLSRFRANPRAVRVSILHTENLWQATITPFDTCHSPVTRTNPSPKLAMTFALRAAAEAGIPGIDLALSWAYEHPWGKAVGR